MDLPGGTGHYLSYSSNGYKSTTAQSIQKPGICIQHLLHSFNAQLNNVRQTPILPPHRVPRPQRRIPRLRTAPLVHVQPDKLPLRPAPHHRLHPALLWVSQLLRHAGWSIRCHERSRMHRCHLLLGHHLLHKVHHAQFACWRQPVLQLPLCICRFHLWFGCQRQGGSC
ncbi:hypothetical protein BDQ17DRAFT_166379 [Cyathus striatus]|nr:hypothetical protein BDQ17DRAFT_166379 [Cyathus striatus]